MSAADRFDGKPQEFDLSHPDLGWAISEPIPYYPQTRPTLAVRFLMLTIFRRYRCSQRWCSWPATEQGGTCDHHLAAGESNGPGADK